MNNEALPQIVNEFVESIGRPVIEKLENETRQPIAVSVTVIDRGSIIFTSAIPSGSLNGAPATGELRLALKERTNSVSFDGQAVLRHLADGTGCSGFLLHGKIGQIDGSFKAELRGRTMTYNVWDWQPAFRCATDDSTKS